MECGGEPSRLQVAGRVGEEHGVCGGTRCREDEQGWCDAGRWLRGRRRACEPVPGVSSNTGQDGLGDGSRPRRGRADEDDGRKKSRRRQMRTIPVESTGDGRPCEPDRKGKGDGLVEEPSDGGALWGAWASAGGDGGWRVGEAWTRENWSRLAWQTGVARRGRAVGLGLDRLERQRPGPLGLALCGCWQAGAGQRARDGCDCRTGQSVKTLVRGAIRRVQTR